MSECASIDPLVTPYVDRELPEAERRSVDDHLSRCASCRARVEAEARAQALVAAERWQLCRPRAPERLRTACAALARPSAASEAGIGADVVPFESARRAFASAPPPVRTWRARLAPLATAAALVLVVGGAFLARMTDRSAQVMAAELTADHVKCFAVNALLGTNQSAETVEASLSSGFGWPLRFPGADRAGLRLVGARPCLYGQGRVAHVMFTHDGRPVSLFMLPGTARAPQALTVLGHEAAIWCAGTRTFVLIGREPRAELERMAAAVRAAVN